MASVVISFSQRGGGPLVMPTLVTLRNLLEPPLDKLLERHPPIERLKRQCLIYLRCLIEPASTA